jgi:predicted nuclease of predicted toxin-antitoxin system
MNLSPQWVDFLNARGHDAVHWSSVGSADATDNEIMQWASGNECIVFTSDLDFSAMLALSGSPAPSVVQLRSDATLPASVGSIVAEAIDQAAADLSAGALLTIEVRGARVRILPFDLEP